MILEGLVTTANADGTSNLAPMGPVVSEDWSTLLFRPFPASITYRNLTATREGVLHVVDDVWLLAAAALDQLASLPKMVPAAVVTGQVLADCCRWYEFRVSNIDLSGERPCFHANVVHAGRVRDFWGLNRAKSAVVEAAILASRRRMLPADEITEQIDRFRSIVAKTGGPAERAALELVETVLGSNSSHSR